MYKHPVCVSQDVLCLQEVRMAAAGPKGENLSGLEAGGTGIWEWKTNMAWKRKTSTLRDQLT